VSSYQIDQAERGFSFMRQGPLDMRMEQAGRSAADVVNETEADALADIIYHYGEERQSRRIARAIVAHREENGPFATTADLANVVRRVVRKSKDGIDPATRTFQGLRIFVNDEIGELRRGLAAAERILRPGGRLVVVSFHSLEDREVKAFMRDRAASSGAGGRLLPGETAGPAPTFSLVTRKAIAASAEEARQNPRARSAKLRAAERLDQPARTDLPQTTVVGGGL
jgi:16S rRNA (cytosine1402-N4)-methyltransferase